MSEETGISRDVDQPGPGAYEPPAILWEEQLPQGPNLFSACGKIGGGGELCNSMPSS
jgi:hypothetical protein